MRRRHLIDELRGMAQRIERLDPSPNLLHSVIFRILYGVSFELQLAVATAVAERFLLIIERRHPKSTAPRRLLDDPVAWQAAHGEARPGYPNCRHSADAHYDHALGAILDACEYPDVTAVVTSQVCRSIGNAIHARAVNAWEADEPDKAEYRLRDGDITHPFTVFGSPLYGPIVRREWGIVVDLLEAKQVADLPDDVDLAAMETALAVWAANHYLYLSPDEV